MEGRMRLRERWRGYQPSKGVWLWSCAASALAVLILGFGWGGWMTVGTADRLVANARQDTRDRLAAAVCVKRFEAAPDAATHLAALAKTGSWDQADFINKGGWVQIPGIDGPLSDAAAICAEKLLATKPASTPLPRPTDAQANAE